MDPKMKAKAKKTTSTTTTTPPPRLKVAQGPPPQEKGPGIMERISKTAEDVKGGLYNLLPKAGTKLAFKEENFEPEKKMVGKAQRGVGSYLRGSMGKGGM
jgi:hypothetical protein